MIKAVIPDETSRSIDPSESVISGHPTGHVAKRGGAANPALKSNALQIYNRGFRAVSSDAVPWR